LGILTLCKEFGFSLEDYWDIKNPAQQEILSYISEIADYDRGKIGIGTDGCGVPVFAMPMKQLAKAYLRLACPELIEDSGTRKAVQRIAKLMNENNEYVSGTNLICTLLLQDSNIFAKGGAKGSYCFGLKKEQLGFAIKVMDGSEEEWPLIIAAILEQIGYENKDTIKRLRRVFPQELMNDNNRIVGRSKVVFQLTAKDNNNEAGGLDL
jgi:L-asparaginase II